MNNIIENTASINNTIENFVHVMNTTNRTENTYAPICDPSSCLPVAIVVLIIFLLGLTANVVVIGVIIKERRLHKPTFVLICSLAVADFTFLFSRLPLYALGFFADDIDDEAGRRIRLALSVIGLLAGSASVIHIVVIAGLRYFIVVHPLKSYVCLTNTRVLLLSICAWTFAFASSSWYSYGLIVLGLESDVFQYTNFVITIFYSVFPIVLIVSLHIFKAKELLESLSNCTSNTVQNMSRVVTIIIVSFLVTTTPANVVDILVISYGYRSYDSKTFFIITRLSKILLYLNFTANPFIYFVHSQQFRKSIKRCCCPHVKQTERSHTALSHLQSLSMKSNTST